MSIRTTQKAIKSSYYNIISIPYCDAQDLLSYRDKAYYTSGVYGWNADIYIVDYDTVIVTGYRPFGTPANRDILRKYEAKAKQIKSDYTLTYKQMKNKLDKLMQNFLNELLNN